MKKVSIIGSCVGRDALRLHNNSEFCVERFVQDIHPVSVGANSNIGISYESIMDTTMKQYDIPNFYRKMFALEFSGAAINYLSEVSSDFLVIDIACCRFDLINGKAGLRTKYVRFFYETAINDFCMTNDIPLFSETISDENELRKLMDQYLPIFFDKILQLYPINKIIFLEIVPVDFCLCKTGVIRECNSGRKKIRTKLIDYYKDRIEYGNKLAMKYLKGAHVIEFPSHILADENHTWGPNRLHYIPEYYNYVFEAYKVIAKTLPFEKEKEILCKLKVECGKKCYSKYSINLHNTFRAQNEIKLANFRLMKYIDYFRDILLNPPKLSAVVSNFNEKGIKHCAFYGLSQVTIFYIKYFEKKGIIVDYLIENGNDKQYDGHILRLPRSTTDYPETDLIIIGDIMNIPVIESKLKEITKIPLSDVFKLVDKDFIL